MLSLPIEILEKIACLHNGALFVLLGISRELNDRSKKPGMLEMYSDNVTVIDMHDRRTVAGRLHAIGKPTSYTECDYESWHYNGKFHREDGPACEWAHGDKEWFINGKRHREDGPAIEHANGDKEWFISGKRH